MLAKTDAAQVIVQVREAAELMASGQWVPGQTEHAFAAKHGLSIAAVRDRAAEARRLVAGAIDLEELRGLVLAQLDGIAGECRQKDPRVAVSALLAMAQIAGLVVTRHVDTRIAKPTKQLPPAERLAEIEKIRGQLLEAEEEARRELETVDVAAPESFADELRS